MKTFYSAVTSNSDQFESKTFTESGGSPAVFAPAAKELQTPASPLRLLQLQSHGQYSIVT